ncbi:MAG: GH116 family glycosyl-hydrolase [Bacteroidales bacterium]
MKTLPTFIVILFLSALQFENVCGSEWPVLKRYDQEHIYKIALPIGGIGTGTVSLGGRGNLQDWEIMSRPAKGYNPGTGRENSAFFTLFTEIDGKKDLRLLEGPVPFYLYEGNSGAIATNHGLPRFKEVSFEAAYPFGQVNLKTPQVPIEVKIKAFNPLIPGDIDNSSIPMAVIDFELTNTTNKEISFSICGTMQNFIGEDGSEGKAIGNKNTFKKDQGISGIFFSSEGVDKNVDQWGEIALVSTSKGNVSYRTAWLPERWGSSILDFWDDLSKDGQLENRIDSISVKPMASLAVSDVLPANAKKTIRFLITWYFPNRTAWASKPLKNYYATKYNGAWDIATKSVPQLAQLENKTIEFVKAFCNSDIPEDVKEAALFNVSTLRTQTCFRLSDGNFFAWEGCGDKVGCCFGTCTHVWNYETATAFLFGDLARTFRNVEFGLATKDNGLMSFRVKLPLDNIPEFAKVAADGQMGCIIKLFREWQLSGDDIFLKGLYPKAKSALSYAWIKGGWDANQDGVMEGVQHNTMDVEYYGPNPQMTIWYLGALRAMEEMSTYMKDKEMALKCRKLFESGSKWTDENLFNGEYYIHKVIVPKKEEIPAEQLIGMGSSDYGNPEYQLGEGCLVDQLVGQYLAHVCGLGYLVKKENVATTLQSIMKYNYQPDFSDHFNCFRSYVLGEEAALLMASYPRTRPVNPFPYFTEVMTGFEYVAAIGMLYEGQVDDGLKCIKNIRDRYDGRKRSPFDEAECGHHYGRAMTSWSALLALTGFHYSGVNKEITFGNIIGKYFWSNGYSYGTVDISLKDGAKQVNLNVLNGKLEVAEVTIEGIGKSSLKAVKTLQAGDTQVFNIKL